MKNEPSYFSRTPVHILRPLARAVGLGIDEGMFTPSQIAALDLKKRGLKIDPKDIWNPGNGGLTDAIIRLNAGIRRQLHGGVRVA